MRHLLDYRGCGGSGKERERERERGGGGGHCICVSLHALHHSPRCSQDKANSDDLFGTFLETTVVIEDLHGTDLFGVDVDDLAQRGM